jgi:hypothetical protein
MDGLPFLHYFLYNRSGPDEITSDVRRPEFSQRPGMHQPIEDLEGSPFTWEDREFLSQMGICSEISGTDDQRSHGSKSSSKANCGRK